MLSFEGTYGGVHPAEFRYAWGLSQAAQDFGSSPGFTRPQVRDSQSWDVNNLVTSPRSFNE